MKKLFLSIPLQVFVLKENIISFARHKKLSSTPHHDLK